MPPVTGDIVAWPADRLMYVTKVVYCLKFREWHRKQPIFVRCCFLAIFTRSSAAPERTQLVSRAPMLVPWVGEAVAGSGHIPRSLPQGKGFENQRSCTCTHQGIEL